MKHTKLPSIIKILSAFLVISAQASEPVESGAGRVCGTLKSFQGEIQVFDSTRTHLGDAAFGTKLRCGDWISVEKGTAVLEHFSGAALAISDRSFVQVLDPQSGENPDRAQFTLYRGEMMVSAPSSRSKGAAEIRVVTPNSIIRVIDGAAYALYSTSAEESQAIGLGGKVSIENRFFPDIRMSANFAQFVSFADPVERLAPEQARYVNAHDLNERLAKLGVPASVRDAVEKAVKLGAKTKMPTSLARTQPKVSVPEGGEFHAATRASEAPLTASEKLAPNAAPQRAPASAARRVVAAQRSVAKDEPDFSLKRKSSDEEERKRLLQALSSIHPDEE